MKGQIRKESKKNRKKKQGTMKRERDKRTVREGERKEKEKETV